MRVHVHVCVWCVCACVCVCVRESVCVREMERVLVHRHKAALVKKDQQTKEVN